MSAVVEVAQLLEASCFESVGFDDFTAIQSGADAAEEYLMPNAPPGSARVCPVGSALSRTENPVEPSIAALMARSGYQGRSKTNASWAQG
jgi:hypothetical protein